MRALRFFASLRGAFKTRFEEHRRQKKTTTKKFRGAVLVICPDLSKP
jgi:hypothetical protein